MLDAKFWERYFRVYDILNSFIPYQELLDTVCDELDIKQNETILEAGCGTGNLAMKIKARGANVVGLDSCKEALEIYRKKDPEADTILADLTQKLPFEDNYFDGIACNNTLYTIPKEKQLAVLREFYRILKPGGKLVLADPLKGAKPGKIYLVHVKKLLKERGMVNTIKNIIMMFIPTLKMFYFNSKILKEKKHSFLSKYEQEKLLKGAKFLLQASKFVYAEQIVLNSTCKPLK